MALPQTKVDATEARLAELTLPDGAAWANEARADALSRLRTMGLPGPRDEYWRFTRPDALNAPLAPEASLFAHQETMLFDGIDRLRVVFRDGVFDAEASDDLTAENLEIERLADLRRAAASLRRHLGVARPTATTVVAKRACHLLL